MSVCHITPVLMRTSVNLDFSTGPPSSYGEVVALESLSLNGCSGWVTDEVIESLAIGGKLKSVSLFRCCRLTDRSVYYLMKHCGKSLKHLSLAGCSLIGDKSMKYIARFSISGIESIDLTRCPLITDLGINHLCSSIPTLRSLRSLRLYANSVLGESSYQALSELSQIEELDLCGHSNLTDEILLNIMIKCQNLRELNLSWCTSLGDHTVADIVKTHSLRVIRSLSLFGIKNITNTVQLIEYLAEDVPTIRELDIRGIPGAMVFTENDCALLRQRIPQLEKWKLHT
jgi:hypothetical protein